MFSEFLLFCCSVNWMHTTFVVLCHAVALWKHVFYAFQTVLMMIWYNGTVRDSITNLLFVQLLSLWETISSFDK
jgi:hypothetical protein